MWGLLHAIELTNLIKGVDRWGETTVETENLVLNDGSQRQVVEKLSELLPYVSVAVLSEALIIETVPIVEQWRD